MIKLINLLIKCFNNYGVYYILKKSKCYTKLPPQDIIAIFLIGIVLPLAFIFEITYVLTFWHNFGSKEWLKNVIPLLMLGINAYLNIFQLIRVGPNGIFSQTSLPLILKPGYKYCHQCNINSPPRSYHCQICNVCIYRRDHHCSFAGVCVGHFNQRYFIGAISSLFLISLCCCWWNWNLLYFINLPKFMSFQIWQFMFPHVALIFSFISFYQFFLILFNVSSIIVFIFITYLISAQVFCLWRGQTRIEYLLDVHVYNLQSFFENIREALGERWPLLFISPFLDTNLKSNGISFRLTNYENVEKRL